MDKNTIIGFLLIGVVLIVFTWLNQPTPEQIFVKQQTEQYKGDRSPKKIKACR